MEKLKSPYGNRADKLPSPVVTDDFEAEMAKALGEAPQVSLNKPAEASNFEGAMAQALGETPQASEQTAEIPMQPEPSFAEANSPMGLAQQMGDAYQRLRYAFTVTDRESLNALKNSGAYADVKRNEDGELIIKRHGAKKYERFDKKTFELIGDLLDQTRIGFETASEYAGAGLGALAGLGTTGGLASVPAAMAGSATLGVGAQQAGDAFAQNVLGIERDPSRSRLNEALFTGGVSAVFGGLFAKIARSSANAAARNKAQAVTEDVIRQNLDEARNAVQQVQQAGIKLGKDGKFILDPDQLAGDVVPEFKETFKQISSDPRIRKMRIEQGKVLSEAFDSVTQMIGNTTGKAVGKVTDFSMDTKALRQFEGKLIGQFRDQALQQSKNVPHGMQNFSAKVGDLFGQLSSKSGKVDDMAELAMETFPELPPHQAKYLASQVNRFQKLMSDNAGMLDLKRIDAEYSTLTKKIDSLMNSSTGRDLAFKLIDMKNAMRDDWMQAIKNNLPPQSMAKYEQSLSKYSTVMGGVEELKNLLKNDTVPLDALAENLFKGGIGKGDKIRAVKTLLMENDPNAWRDLTGQYMQSLITKFKDGDNINWKGFQTAMGKLSSDVQKELFEGTGVDMKLINALSHLGKSVENAKVGFTPTTKQKGLMRRAVYLMVNQMASTKIDNAEAMLNGLGKDKAVGIWLKEGGAEELMQSFAPKSKTRKVLQSFFSQYDPNTAMGAARKTLKTGARRGGLEFLSPFMGTGTAGDMSSELGPLNGGE